MAEAAGLLIRDAKPDDEAAWRRLWSGYNSFYQVDVPEAVTAKTWERILDPQVQMIARVADVDGAVLGFTISVPHPSTWTPELDCYLEDLFVASDARGRGVGRALLAELARIARERGCQRLEWWVLDWNEPALGFYRSLGARAMDEWTVYRLTGEPLERLASEAG